MHSKVPAPPAKKAEILELLAKGIDDNFAKENLIDINYLYGEILKSVYEDHNADLQIVEPDKKLDQLFDE